MAWRCEGGAPSDRRRASIAQGARGRLQLVGDELEELSPAYLAWQRLPADSQEPQPPLSPEDQAKADALMAEYLSLPGKK